MNYLLEILRFTDFIITNDIPPSSILLWYSLMAINNRCNWKQEFNVSISTLQSLMKYSKSEIYRSRDCLVKLGRIKVEERSGNQSSVYSIIPFCPVDKPVYKLVSKERS